VSEERRRMKEEKEIRVRRSLIDWKGGLRDRIKAGMVG